MCKNSLNFINKEILMKSHKLCKLHQIPHVDKDMGNISAVVLGL
jgi:hypothetical protein